VDDESIDIIGVRRRGRKTTWEKDVGEGRGRRATTWEPFIYKSTLSTSDPPSAGKNSGDESSDLDSARGPDAAVSRWLLTAR
jgi:hypothetical protein